jgi:hypothetical protein
MLVLVVASINFFCLYLFVFLSLGDVVDRVSLVQVPKFHLFSGGVGSWLPMQASNYDCVGVVGGVQVPMS